MSHSGKNTLNLGQLLKPHSKQIAFAILAVVGEGVADLAQPWPLKLILDNVLRARPMEGRLNDWILANVGADKLALVKFAAIASLVIAAVNALCSYAEKYLTTSVGQWVMHDLRRMLYSHIQRLSLSFHDAKRSGDLISSITSDIDSIQSFITSGLLGALVNVLTLFGMMGVMFYINWKFTLIALSVAPALFLVVFSYTRKIKKAAREVRKKEGEILSVIQEVFSSIRVVKAFAREDYEEKRLEGESLESIEIALRARSLKAKLSPLVEIIVACGTALVLWFGARMVIEETLSAGTLVLFIVYLGKMYKPMQELSKMTDAYSKAEVGYERIKEVLDTDLAIKDLPGARKALNLKGKVEFDNVSFHYQPDSPILKDVSFTIEPGQVAAIVGPTGSGKSTIIGLIPRFYDPVCGVVKIDGVDVRRYRQKSLRQQMSFVLQDTLLFNAPVWTNIAYGRPEATRQEILHAAELANAHEFIQKMPQGYDTMVGERGVTLSGGQRQRIAIARAVVRNTPILIMDEPSSGLDANSEKLVFEALDRLMKGKTSIVIAHRFSTIRAADVIFVVKEGQLVERGSHDELMNIAGVYAELYQLQFSAEGAE